MTGRLLAALAVGLLQLADYRHLTEPPLATDSAQLGRRQPDHLPIIIAAVHLSQRVAAHHQQRQVDQQPRLLLLPPLFKSIDMIPKLTYHPPPLVDLTLTQQYEWSSRLFIYI